MHIHTHKHTHTYAHIYTYKHTYTHYPRDDALDEFVQSVKTIQPLPHQHHGNVCLPPMPAPTQSEYQATQYTVVTS